MAVRKDNAEERVVEHLEIEEKRPEELQNDYDEGVIDIG